MRRRFFLKCLAVTTAATISPLPVFAEGITDFSYTTPAMGTFVTITCTHCNKNKADEAVGSAFEKLAAYEKLLTRFSSDSPLGVLNNQGKLVSPPVELLDVANYSKKVFKISDQLFDPCVLGDVLMSKHDQQIKHITYQDVVISKSKFILPGKDHTLTFDGVAKGYIVDLISAHLIGSGIENHMVNAGGDISAKGLAADGKPWVIAVNSPTGEYSKAFYLHNKAIATSGEYEQPLDSNGNGHIINPKTGLSPRTVVSTSIIAPSAMEADALSTAVFVMGEKKGSELIAKVPNWGCMFHSREGSWIASKNWPSPV